MTASQNLLVFISDEHNPKIMGCSGSSIAVTPHLDALAARGTRFSAAYCNSPACVPARAVLATGRYVQDLGNWDNAQPFDGSAMSWHRRIRDSGSDVTAIGKLHFRSSDDDNGFTEEIVPMHVVDGVGDLGDLIRDELPVRGGVAQMAMSAGPGESSYTAYDRDIAARAQAWLKNKSAEASTKPWVLFVSFVAPHFPLTAPPEHFFRFYNNPDLPWPKLYGESERPNHPYLRDYAHSLPYDDYFDSPEKVRAGLAGYLGLCSFLDEQIGQVMSCLERCGLADQTRIVYTSDHGENLGARGLWGKTTMYEESAGVPLIIAGAGFGVGHVCTTPVSHVDLYPTFLEATGVERLPSEADLPGQSLFDVWKMENGRTAFAEFHGMGSKTAAYMLRDDQYKYIYYVGYPAQLFDLTFDPEEKHDLAALPEQRERLIAFEKKLRTYCDPEAVDAKAKAVQKALLIQHGGREKVLEKGDFSFSPAPGTAAVFEKAS
ncbi:sulfatase-like hydrolase/transferase [Paraburkholderia sp. Ac-20336]|uniref:sulfatase-like hydrolase/transferase n=1 Tax=Paraburkholderia sp. Ac-20336 TaxID=2703886 RepID=UPI00197E955B|nr:sulfatase-like hydrolase/transferase [Paraburkholderia sp. Ac-20336]MBN3803705.1 sulfatase-like hydrolase/transferase [Paraburkholderia sp. Ac-20336]